MSTPEKLTPAEIAEIKKRVAPIVAKTTIQSLRAWLKTRGLKSTATSKDDLVNRVTSLISKKELEESTLEAALIGFEEATGKRIYLFKLENLPLGAVASWIPTRLAEFSIPPPSQRQLAGTRSKPMSPVYSELNGDVLRVKWTEVQTEVKIDPQTDERISNEVEKKIIFIADFKKKVAELRLDPPENRHSYEDANWKSTPDAYYSAYKQRAADIVGDPFVKPDLRKVIAALVEEEEPRVVRIHIDNHTNQGDLRYNVKSRKDIRDNSEWRAAWKQYGSTWAWDSQSFFWLPEPSGKRLNRELFSHLDAIEGFIKVNANCSDEEVEYAVSQVRAR